MGAILMPIDYLKDEHYVNTFKINTTTYITIYAKGIFAHPTCHKVYSNGRGRYIKINRKMLKNGGYMELNGLLYVTDGQLRGEVK